MAKTKIARPANVIKGNITPLASDIKSKVAAAITAVVNAIKEKHL